MRLGPSPLPALRLQRLHNAVDGLVLSGFPDGGGGAIEAVISAGVEIEYDDLSFDQLMRDTGRHPEARGWRHKFKIT